MGPGISGILFLGTIGMFVVGVVLVVVGIRGRPRLHAPRCASCRYDLRGHDPQDTGCPECGADLSHVRAVDFGHFVRSRRTIVTGVLLVAPVVLLYAAAIVQSLTRFNWSQMRSDASVIESVASAPNRPGVWNELTRRYRAGDLDDAEVATVVDHYIDYVKTGANLGGTAVWADTFISTAIQDGVVAEEQHGRLCDAVLGRPPTLQLRDRVRTGASPQFMLSFGRESLSGVFRIAAVDRVLLDGERELDITDFRGKPETPSVGEHGMLVGGFKLDGVTPGEHEVTFVVDAGVVPAGTDLGPRNEPGPAARWPETTIRRWRREVTATVTVLPEHQPAIMLVNNPQTGREIRKGLVVHSCTLWPMSRGRQQLRIGFDFDRSPPVPVAFDLIVRLGEEERKAGSFTAGFGGTSSSSGSITLTDVPDSIETVDVIFRPDIERAEQNPQWERVWSGEIVFEDVPLERREN